MENGGCVCETQRPSSSGRCILSGLWQDIADGICGAGCREGLELPGVDRGCCLQAEFPLYQGAPALLLMPFH